MFLRNYRHVFFHQLLLWKLPLRGDIVDPLIFSNVGIVVLRHSLQGFYIWGYYVVKHILISKRSAGFLNQDLNRKKKQNYWMVCDWGKMSWILTSASRWCKNSVKWYQNWLFYDNFTYNLRNHAPFCSNGCLNWKNFINWGDIFQRFRFLHRGWSSW